MSKENIESVDNVDIKITIIGESEFILNGVRVENTTDLCYGIISGFQPETIQYITVDELREPLDELYPLKCKNFLIASGVKREDGAIIKTAVGMAIGIIEKNKNKD